MTSITLNGLAVVQLQQSAASGFSLQNTGPGVVYLGSDASVTPSTGYAVAVGVSLPLSGGATIYACTDAGKLATVQLLQGAQAGQATVVEANIPGAVQVTGTVQATIENATVPISGSVNATIQNASIPVTGTVNIGAGSVDITSGSVSVAGGQVGVQSNPTVLSTTQTVFATVGSPQNLTAIPNVGGLKPFASVIVGLTDNSINALAATNMVSLQMYQTLNGVIVGPTYNPQYLLGLLRGSLQIPVVGDTLVISGQYAGTFSSGGTLTVQITGSNEIITDPRYISYNAGSGPVGIASGGYYETSTAAVVSSFVSSRNGAGQLSVLAATSTSGGSANVAVCEFVGPAQPILAGTGAIATGGAANVPIILPMRPVQVTTRPSAGTLICSLLQ